MGLSICFVTIVVCALPTLHQVVRTRLGYDTGRAAELYSLGTSRTGTIVAQTQEMWMVSYGILLPVEFFYLTEVTY